MKVFISWSGERSRQVAEYLKKWLKRTLQQTDPWISTQGLESGSNWFTSINDQLASTDVGIICVTQANKDNPWILFEAGALIKGLSESRVIPLLIDVEKSEIKPPLGMLQSISFNENEFHKLCLDINNKLEAEKRLDSFDFKDVFDINWPLLKENFDKILSLTNQQEIVKKRETDDILNEVLLVVRGLDSRVRQIEINRISSSFHSGIVGGSYEQHQEKTFQEKIDIQAEVQSKMKLFIESYYNEKGVPPSENEIMPVGAYAIGSFKTVEIYAWAEKVRWEFMRDLKNKNQI